MGGHLVFPFIGTLAYSNLPLVQETGSTSLPLTGELTITYSVNQASGITYPLLVEFFLADNDDEEGETFLDDDTYTTNNTSRVIVLGANSLGISLGDVLVATAIDDDGNTSAFSTDVTVTV